MDAKQTDVNSAAASSAVATNAGAAATDANAASSVAQTATQANAAKAETMADVIEQQFKKSVEAQSASTAEEGAKEESGSIIEQDAQADTESKGESEGSETGNEKEEVASEENEADKKGPVPYERFQEKTVEVNTLKQKLESVQPKVKNYDEIVVFCQKHSISPEQFHGIMKVQALLNTNPEAALKELMPIVEQLQGFTGGKLPTDLQTAVDGGDITLNYARELAKARAQGQFSQNRVQQSEEQVRQQQEHLMRQQLSQAVNAWETSKRASDPMYKPSANIANPGLWELTKDKFLAMASENDLQTGQPVHPLSGPNEMTALMEKSYQYAKSVLKQLKGTKPAIKAKVSSNGSSTSTNNKVTVETAKTMVEAMQVAAAGHGITI